ncbi:MAG: methyltransferase family protein [Fidelibacterota bacterium]
MNTGTLLRFMIILFPVSELLLLLFRRRQDPSSQDVDKGSLRVLWITILASVGITVSLQWYSLTPLPFSRVSLQEISLLFLISGYVLRWISILILGRWFTPQVTIQPHQVLIQKGPYKRLRHPSYTGLLLEFVGLGIFFGTWVSLLIMTVPITIAIINRINTEEAALLATFGETYRQYQQRTKRLFPGIY